jgi:glucose-6-phosphate isomerase
MSDFLSYPSAKKLQELAKNPPDLTKSNLLNPQRIKDFCIEGVGLKLLYATERVDEEIVKYLKQLAVESQCLEKNNQMQDGQVLNRIIGFKSEEREVLHTAVRDLFEERERPKKVQEAVDASKKEHAKLKNFLKKIEGRFSNLITIGIGGSELGPQALYNSLDYLNRKGKTIHFISNIDPDNTYAAVKKSDLKKTLVTVVSKSGSTLETVTNEAFLRSIFIKNGLNPNDHFVAITGEGSPMDDPQKYLESFYFWDYIGGRYSATSMCGGVLLSFMLGYETYLEVLKGAHAMDVHARSAPVDKNIPLNLALFGIWSHDFLNLPTVALIPYCQAMNRFPAHIQQLDMESNGKHIDIWGKKVAFKTGPVIFGEPGSSAQHSFFQLIHQGTEVIHLELIGFKKNQYPEDFTSDGTTSQEKLLSNLIAQAISLATGKKSDNPNKEFEGNRPSSMLVASQLTPFTMGALLSCYENKVDFQGFIWNINSFDQEGVQLGKVLAVEMMKQFADKHKEVYPLGNAYLQHINNL